MRPPPENIFTDVSRGDCGDVSRGDVSRGDNLYNLCMAPAPAPIPCIAVSLYRCIAF